MLFWTVVLEKTLESPLDCKEIQPVHPEGNQSWIFIGRTDAEADTTILLPADMKNWLIGKDSDAGKRLKAGEGDDRGWDGWMASSIWWTRIWVSSGSWWWTGKPSVLQFMVSQRVGHDWVTELNWTDLYIDVQRGCLKFQKYCHPFPGPPPIVLSLISILGLFKRWVFLLMVLQACPLISVKSEKFCTSWFHSPKQCCPLELSVRMEMFYI